MLYGFLLTQYSQVSNKEVIFLTASPQTCPKVFSRDSSKSATRKPCLACSQRSYAQISAGCSNKSLCTAVKCVSTVRDVCVQSDSPAPELTAGEAGRWLVL